MYIRPTVQEMIESGNGSVIFILLWWAVLLQKSSHEEWFIVGAPRRLVEELTVRVMGRELRWGNRMPLNHLTSLEWLAFDLARKQVGLDAAIDSVGELVESDSDSDSQTSVSDPPGPRYEAEEELELGVEDESREPSVQADSPVAIMSSVEARRSSGSSPIREGGRKRRRII